MNMSFRFTQISLLRQMQILLYSSSNFSVTSILDVNISIGLIFVQGARTQGKLTASASPAHDTETTTRR